MAIMDYIERHIAKKAEVNYVEPNDNQRIKINFGLPEKPLIEFVLEPADDEANASGTTE